MKPLPVASFSSEYMTLLENYSGVCRHLLISSLTATTNYLKFAIPTYSRHM